MISSALPLSSSFTQMMRLNGAVVMNKLSLISRLALLAMKRRNK